MKKLSGQPRFGGCIGSLSRPKLRTPAMRGLASRGPAGVAASCQKKHRIEYRLTEPRASHRRPLDRVPNVARPGRAAEDRATRPTMPHKRAWSSWSVATATPEASNHSSKGKSDKTATQSHQPRPRPRPAKPKPQPAAEGGTEGPATASECEIPAQFKNQPIQPIRPLPPHCRPPANAVPPSP